MGGQEIRKLKQLFISTEIKSSEGVRNVLKETPLWNSE